MTLIRNSSSAVWNMPTANSNTIGVRTTLTKTDYFNRSLAATPGLATGLDQTAYELYYHRVLSAKLEIDAAGGVTQTTVSSPASSSTFSGATYSVKSDLVRDSEAPSFQPCLPRPFRLRKTSSPIFEKIRTESPDYKLLIFA